MRRATWFASCLVAVVCSVAADGPAPAGKPAPSSEKPATGARAARSTPAAPAAAAAAGAATTNASPDPRATSLFRAAQNLEKSGKQTGAIGLYRDILIRYPASLEASGAAARVRALGGKIPGQGEINPAPPPEGAKFTRAPKPKYASQEANRAALNQAVGGMVGSAASQPAASGYQKRGAYSP